MSVAPHGSVVGRDGALAELPSFKRKDNESGNPKTPPKRSQAVRTVLVCETDWSNDGAVNAALLAGQHAVAARIPRGKTCHYYGCGCAAPGWHGGSVDWVWSWRPDIALSKPFTRAALPAPISPSALLSRDSSTENEVTAAIERLTTWNAGGVSHPVVLPSFAPRAAACRPLRISYLIPHHNVTGGMKMIMKQIELLHARGHWVQAVFKSGNPASPVLPPWASDVAVDDMLLLPPEASILSCFSHADVLIVGYFTQLLELIQAGCVDCPGPVVYWDQGHEHVFGDPTSSPEWDVIFHAVMRLPIVLLSVSNVIRDILITHFSRVAPVIPNAINTCLFYESAQQRKLMADAQAGRALAPRVLIVGHPGLPLKNFSTSLHALNILHASHPGLEVTWMCQAMPSLTGTTFPVNYIVNPSQSDVPAVYQAGYHALLFGSVYEAWGMPVMEAMASGIPVVTSACYGVNMFCEHDYNCLMTPATDATAMAAALHTLIDNPALAATLAARALAVVTRFTWDHALTLLEDALFTSVWLLHHPPAVTTVSADVKSAMLTPTLTADVKDEADVPVLYDLIEK